MKLKHIYTIIVALLLFTGCAENEIYEDVNGTSHELVPLRFNIPAMAEVETRGISLPENETMVGETVGIFMLTEEEYKDLLEGSIKYVGNDAQKDGKTVTYDYYHNLHKIEGYVVKHNVQFCVEEDGSLNAVNGDSLFYSTTGGTAVFAYSPYDLEMTKEKLFQSVVSVSADQITNQKVLDNYFRLATPVRGDKTSGNPIVSYQRSISLHFRHQLSRIVLKTSFGDLKEMCWDKEWAEDVDRIDVCVDNVPVSGKRALAKDGLNYAYSEHTLGLVSMASYSLSQSEVPDSIYPNVLLVPTENKVVPRFKLVFYKGEDQKVVGLTVRTGEKDVIFGVGASLNFNCTYGEEDKLRDAFVRGAQNYTLNEDVTLSESLILAEGKRMTLNLNGHSISMEKECTADFEMILNLGDLTIIDEPVSSETKSKVRGSAVGAASQGRISFTDTGVADPSFGRGSYTINNKGKLVVNGGLIENLSEQNTDKAVHMYCAIQQSSGTTIVNGGVVSNPTYRSIRINKGELIVNGGTMVGQVWLQPNQGDVTIEVNGGDFSPRGVDGSSIFMANTEEKYDVSSAKITDGTFQTKIGSNNPTKEGVKGCITGGTFTETAMQNTNKNLFAEETYLVKNDEGNYIVKHSTDETQDLLTAFRNGGEYQLEEDVILIHPLTLAKGKALVLDLNGHSIIHEMKCTVSYNMITNNGDLTIKGEGEISFTDTSAGGGDIWGSYTIYNYGTLDVSDATIVHNGSTGDWGTDRPTNIPIDNHMGKVTVNSGTISSKMFRSLRDYTAGGEIVINGGKFEGQIWMQGLGTGSSSLTITGGEFEPLYDYDGSSVYLTNGTNDIEFSVTGGIFNTKIGVADPSKAGVKGSVKGGTFTQAAKDNTNTALIAEGHIFVDNGNGTYTLQEKKESVGRGEGVADNTLEALSRTR